MFSTTDGQTEERSDILYDKINQRFDSHCGRFLLDPRIKVPDGGMYSYAFALEFFGNHRDAFYDIVRDMILDRI